MCSKNNIGTLHLKDYNQTELKLMIQYSEILREWSEANRG